ncbi:MAG: Y-family DNA polymerase [Bacteroidota bacterium]|nr:Y-family DNA polymerase [Bacteroidota bacterium]
MKAIVDCNSFYCSCEKVFKPELSGKPIVVLSNNDGCIISRNAEAKSVGIKMAGPFYQASELIEKNNVAVFSSNYNLYGDMSQRIMSILKLLAGEENVEVYSVDESFLDLGHIAPELLESFGIRIKTTIEQWTGVPVSVGIAPTKVLCKVANRFSKKNSSGVMILNSDEKIKEALQKTMVENIWGVGRRSAVKLNAQNIVTAFDLKNVNEEWARKNLGGVVGVRLVKELNGIPCIPMLDPLKTKRMITTSRMFGSKVATLEELEEAVASYIARAAEKLRRQFCIAGAVQVYVVSANRNNKEYTPQSSALNVMLPVSTSLTPVLLQHALPLVNKLYRKGDSYLKAGIILSDLVPESAIQFNLFTDADAQKKKNLMAKVDNINFSMRGDVVKYASSGILRNWRMRQDFISSRYTSRWEELKEVQ